MFSACRRLPGRVAAALAQRRRYVSLVLRGGSGTEKTSYKLTPPWERTAAPKPRGEASRPILGVFKHGGVLRETDESRATLNVIENNVVVASFCMRPAIEACDDRVPGPSSEGTSDEGEESWGHEEEEVWSEDGEEMSDDHFRERIPGLESKSSDEQAILQLMGTLEMTSEDEDVKRSPRRVQSSFVIDICLCPYDASAHATIHRTNDRGDCIWQSSFCFNLEVHDNIDDRLAEPDSVNPEVMYPDRCLIYTGEINDLALQKFRVTFKTHYTVERLLGRGGEADVYECTDLKHSKKCAVKLNKNLYSLYKEPSESQIMKDLSHKNVRQLFCAWSEEQEDVEDEHGSIYLAQEFCKCTLEDVLNETSLMTKEEKTKIFCGALAGLDHVHTKGYVHRDIKCNNILIDNEGHAKIGDFGQSDLICSSACSQGGRFFGTLLFSSPEMFHQKPHDEKTDIYSMGLVYFELFGSPANSVDRDEKLHKLKRLMKTRNWKTNPVLAWEEAELSSAWEGNISVLIHMLKVSPRDRPSCGDLLEVVSAAN